MLFTDSIRIRTLYQALLYSLSCFLFCSTPQKALAQKLVPNSSEKNFKFELDYIDSYPVIFIEAKDGNDVRFEFAFNAGGVTDEKLHGSKLAGLSHFLEHVITASSIKYPYAKHKIWEELGSMGKDVNAETGDHTTEYYWEGASEFASKALELYGELLFNPEFSEDAIEIERSTIQDELRSYLEDLGEGLEDAKNRVIYEKNSPYISNIIGSRKSVSIIQKADLVNHWNQFYNASNAVILISGNFSGSIGLKKDLKDTLTRAIKNSPSNPFYNSTIRSNSKDLLTKLGHIKPSYRDSRFRKIWVKNKERLSEFNLRITFELNPEIFKMNVFTLELLEELLILESPENPIFILKEKGLSTVPTFKLNLEGQELSVEASMSILNDELSKKLEQEDQSALNFLSEAVLTRLIQISKGHMDEAYIKLTKNLLKNNLELGRNQSSNLIWLAKDYLSVIGQYNLSWESIVADLNQFYSSENSKALDEDAYTYASRMLSKPIQAKAFHLHWFLISKDDKFSEVEHTPYQGLGIEEKAESLRLDQQVYSNLNYSLVSQNFKLSLAGRKDSRLVEELLHLRFNKGSQTNQSELNSKDHIQITKNSDITIIRHQTNAPTKQQNMVLRFTNEAEDDLSSLNLEMFLHAFLRSYSKELTIIRSYLTNLFINVRSIHGKQILDFHFSGKSEVIADLAPRVLSWFSQYKVDEKNLLETKKIFSDSLDSTITGNLWDLSFEGLELKSQNFKTGLEDLRYYLSDASTVTQEDLNLSKQIIDGSKVAISLAGIFSDYQIQKIEDSVIKLKDPSSKLVVPIGVQNRRLSFENFDKAGIKQIRLPLARNIDNEKAVLVHSIIQLTRNIHPHSYFMAIILSKMLYRHVFRVASVENKLGYYHAASFTKNLDGLHAMFSGIVDSHDDPLTVKNLLQKHWKKAAERILRNTNRKSEEDFLTIRQSILSELKSEPNFATLASSNLDSWTDFNMHEQQLRENAIQALENSSLEEDIFPMVKKLLPEHSKSNRLTYVVGGGCEYLFRDRIE